MIAKKTVITFFLYQAILVLSVLYAGLLLSALLSIIAGILRTFGLRQISMSIWYNVELPVLLSIPVAFLFAYLLFIGSRYVKTAIKTCATKLPAF